MTVYTFPEPGREPMLVLLPLEIHATVTHMYDLYVRCLRSQFQCMHTRRTQKGWKGRTRQKRVESLAQRVGKRLLQPLPVQLE